MHADHVSTGQRRTQTGQSFLISALIIHLFGIGISASAHAGRDFVFPPEMCKHAGMQDRTDGTKARRACSHVCGESEIGHDDTCPGLDQLDQDYACNQFGVIGINDDYRIAFNRI